MLAVALALTLTCMPAPPEDHVVTSADGGFTLEVTVERLRLREGDAERWVFQRPPEPPEFEDHVVADDGAWVAIVRSPTRDVKAPVLTLLDAKGAPRDVKLFPALTPDERDSLPRTSCGSMWLSAARAKGDALELDILQGGVPLPTMRATAFVTLKVDTKTGKVTRVTPLPKKK